MEFDVFSRSVAGKLRRLEEDWKDLQLLSRGRGRLQDILDNLPALFMKKRRIFLLTTTREIVMSEDFNVVEVQDATERGNNPLVITVSRLLSNPHPIHTQSALPLNQVVFHFLVAVKRDH